MLPRDGQTQGPTPVTRRSALLGGAGVTLLAALAGCDSAPALAGSQRISPTGPEVTQAEQRRTLPGARQVSARLDAQTGPVDLGGRTVSTWSYGGAAPGPLLRGNTGDELAVHVTNRLPAPTTVHWHGLAIRNDMDGVPFLTQPAIAPGGTHDYRFTLPRPGTYWYHSHLEVQRDRGLYGPLIVDDPHAPADHDVEFVVLIDDWIDGTGATPDQVLAALRAHSPDWHYQVPVQAGGVTGGVAAPPAALPTTNDQGQMMTGASPGPGGTIGYPFHLINGRLPTAPATFTAKPGQRAKIRFINASASTVYRVALGGHRLTVTDTDAYPVTPVTVDAIDLASGERYDTLTTLADGAFPLVAVAQGKQAQALAVVRTASGAAPDASVQPAELIGKILALTDLAATEPVRLPDAPPDVTHDLWLDGDMMTYQWRIDGHAYTMTNPFAGISPIPVRPGNRVRLRIQNETPMYHPIHLHGHTFQIRALGQLGHPADTPLPNGPRKDTVSVSPNQRVTIDLVADNPGQWLTHCHNAYHLASGMATILSYLQ